MCKRYEYKIETFCYARDNRHTIQYIETTLNILAAKGWKIIKSKIELVGCSEYVFILEREYKPELDKEVIISSETKELSNDDQIDPRVSL